MLSDARQRAPATEIYFRIRKNRQAVGDFQTGRDKASLCAYQTGQLGTEECRT